MSAQATVMEEAMYLANAEMRCPLVIEKLQNFIISEEAVKKGAIKDAGTYYLGETSRFMPDYIICETETSTVFDALKKMDLGDTAFSYLDELLTTSAQNGFCPNIILHDYNLDYLKKGIDAIFPIVEAKEKDIVVKGTALFHDENMVGKLNSDDTKYLLMLLSSGGNTDYVLNIPLSNEKEKTFATLHINRSDNKIETNPQEEHLLIDSQMKIYGYFDEMEWNRIRNDFSLDEITMSVEQYISEHTVTVARILSTVNCDPMAIEERLRGFHHKYYETHDFDEVYHNAEFNVTVTAHITNEGKPK
ncbi:MAG: Ger(x)C family spore germination C-terminal domain-containing protein [Bacillota bacterium]|nr:Ger(x)C family spore germination C-terminal domain-containing protein [Bacillota bacterium]